MSPGVRRDPSRKSSEYPAVPTPPAVTHYECAPRRDPVDVETPSRHTGRVGKWFPRRWSGLGAGRDRPGPDPDFLSSPTSHSPESLWYRPSAVSALLCVWFGLCVRRTRRPLDLCSWTRSSRPRLPNPSGSACHAPKGHDDSDGTPPTYPLSSQRCSCETGRDVGCEMTLSFALWKQTRCWVHTCRRGWA